VPPSPLDIRSIILAYVEAHASGDVSRLGDIIAPDFHYRDSPPVGIEGVVRGLRDLHAGLSDITCELHQCVCADDWCAFRYVVSGTHTGLFFGQAPTGRRITWSGADFMKLRDGKLFELWSVQESLPLMEGIGAVVRSR